MNGTTTGGTRRALVGPREEKILHFIGVDVDRIHSTPEKVHYLAIAAAVFVGPLTTSAIFVYAAYFVYHATVIATALLTLMVFVVYFFLEFGIATQPTPRLIRDRLRVGGIRLLLVVIVSFLAGEMVTEQYFKTEVAAEVTNARSSQFDEISKEMAAKADENRQIAELEAQRETDLAEIARRQADLTAAQGRVDEIQKLIDAEDNGLLGGRGSGCGEFCEAKKAELVVATADRGRISADVTTAKATLEADIARVDDELKKLRDRVNARIDAAVAAATIREASPAERFSALNRVTFGDGNWPRLPIRIAITIGLMLIEASAVLLKLGRQTRHDVEVIAEDTVACETVNFETEQKLRAIRLQGSAEAHNGNLRDWRGGPTARAKRRAGKELTDIRTDELLDVARAEAEVAKLRSHADLMREKANAIRELYQFKDELEGDMDLDDAPAQDDLGAPSEVQKERQR